MSTTSAVTAKSAQPNLWYVEWMEYTLLHLGKFVFDPITQQPIQYTA